MDYQYFTKLEERLELVTIGNRLAEYVHDNKISNVMFIDNSARPAYLALKHSWNKKYPDEKRPNIYFTNPDGYKLEYTFLDLIVEQFNETYSQLSKNSSLMLFDACMHKGATLRPILGVLKKAGYSNVVVGLAQPMDKNYSPDIDVVFTALKLTSCRDCEPFGREYAIRRPSSSSLLSVSNTFKNRNPYRKEAGLNLRKEIISIFEDTNL
jgi:hypothetical protein